MDQFHSILSNTASGLTRRQDQLRTNVRQDMRDLVEDLKTCINAKFEHHNEYHTNQENRYKVWFKVALGSCFFALVIGSSGYLDDLFKFVIKKLF